LDAYDTDKAKKIFSENKIYTHLELEARHEIMLEEYIKKVQIEARVMGDLATTLILPSALKYQNILLENIKGLKETGMPEYAYAHQKSILTQLCDHVNAISTNVEKMIEARKTANEITDTRERAIAYCDEIKAKYFDAIRYHADKLELMVDDSLWLLPKYREILFLR
jgi:glutamine synthetase